MLALSVKYPNAFTSHLRSADPPIIARIEDDRVVLDPRTVLPEQEEDLLQVLSKLL
jgi:L-seryl-tRNA(Ser) seleniumtransferase